MLKRQDIRIRDPFIYTDKENGCYYMYGTTALCDGTIDAKNSFSVYKSRDLESFSEPKVIFDGDAVGFWADKDFWAAEMHVYRGKYYLFGSCKADGKHRATCIFVSDAPDGTFVPVSSFARTPSDWECLDGTFFVENDIPYMVFSHEWTQVVNGEICAVRLSEDLSCTVGEPVVLFRATENPAVTNAGGENECYVTDGPFLYREDGKIKMIWSSFADGRYLVLCAESDSILGEWKHFPPKFDFDGGHAMVFEALTGVRMISLHAPNTAGKERAVFYPL